MEREIRYCTTTDGVRVAYAVTGDGYPILFIPGWASQLDFTPPPFAGGPFNFVQYDKRGTGLSDRTLGDYSVQTRMLDLEAVVGAAGWHRFALWATSEGVPLAISYAAQYPDRVRRLVLVGGFAIGDRNDTDKATRAALVTLIHADWGIASGALRSLFFDEDCPPEVHGWWRAIQRQALSASDAAAIWEQNGRVDVRDSMPFVRCPTLVAHGRNDRAVPLDLGREVARGISGARFISREGGHVTGGEPALRELQAIREFLLEDEYFDAVREQVRNTTASHQGTTTILFADIVDSTALTERMGDAAFRERARTLDASLRSIIGASGGTPIDGKLLGDGVLATFPGAAQAIDAALRCGGAGTDAGLPLHLGVHAGDVIREDNNVFGGAVNIASRICGLSAPGEILVSDVVRGMARSSAGVVFEDRGEQEMKGVGEPVRVYAVRVRG